jgi:hypothetical protein
MKGPLVIVLGALVLVTVSTLAVMNKTCKSIPTLSTKVMLLRVNACVAAMSPLN